MNYVKNTIGWCDYTFNPIVGCRKGCYYCYAKAMNDRFKFIPDFSKPQFFPERLNEPAKLKKPSKIFVCSMGEIFDGKQEWIEKIIEIIIKCPQHTFMLLTQYPLLYGFYNFFNCWLGLTLTKPDKLKLQTFINSTPYHKRFISIEPIMADFTGFDLSIVDLVVVGAMTGKGAKPTPREWIESVKHHNIFYKESAKKILEQ